MSYTIEKQAASAWRVPPYPPILCRANENGGLDFSKPPLGYVE